MRYPVVIHKEKDNNFNVRVPDILDCYSVGQSYDEALSNAIEAIEGHLEKLLMNNEILPIGSAIDSWIDHQDFQGGIWAVVTIDLSQILGKTKRINITLPERVLHLIDLYGKNHSIKNRSAFLADAALSYMGGNK